MEGKLIIFSAPSGAGKTSVIKELMSQIDKLEFSVSATSRTPREGETNGKDYYFLTADEFKKGINEGKFLEWEEVYENQFYGTLNSEVERIWNQGKHVIFDLDVVGGVNVKKIFKDKALSIFIKPPSVEELKKRLIARSTETESSLNKRIGKAEEELKREKDFDIVIVNEDLKKAQKEAINLVLKFIQ
ncbi:MAG: guanylate kinase [Hyphomicrobiales bacterium]